MQKTKNEKGLFLWALLALVLFVFMSGGCGGGGGGTSSEPAPVPTPGTTVTLYGIVLNKDNGTPIVGANITLHGVLGSGGTTDKYTGTSNDAGRFYAEIPTKNINAYFLTVTADGFEAYSTQFSITSDFASIINANTPLRIELSPGETPSNESWLDGQWRVMSGTYSTLVGTEKLNNLADDVMFTVTRDSASGGYKISVSPALVVLGISASSMVPLYASHFTGNTFTQVGDNFEYKNSTESITYSKSGQTGLRLTAASAYWGADITLQRK